MLALPSGSASAYAGESTTSTQSIARALALASESVPTHATTLRALTRCEFASSALRLALLALLVRRAAQAADDDDDVDANSGIGAASTITTSTSAMRARASGVGAPALLVGDTSMVDEVFALTRNGSRCDGEALWTAVGVLMIIASHNIATLGFVL